jgi:hypothetical protein
MDKLGSVLCFFSFGRNMYTFGGSGFIYIYRMLAQTPGYIYKYFCFGKDKEIYEEKIVRRYKETLLYICIMQRFLRVLLVLI